MKKNSRHNYEPVAGTYDALSKLSLRKPMTKTLEYYVDTPQAVSEANAYVLIKKVLELLKQIQTAESNRHQMDEHLTPKTSAVLNEVIAELEYELDSDC